MSNYYISSVAYAAVDQWAPSTSYVLGDYVRQRGTAIFPAWSGYGLSGPDSVTANFGGTSFAGTPPSGYSAWDATCTFDPANKGAGITLSSGNLVATRASASVWQSAVASVSKFSGKLYYEMVIGSLSATADQFIGIVNGSFDNTSYISDYGGGIHSLGVQATGNLNNISGGNIFAPYVSTSVLCIAVDLDSRIFWYRVGTTGNWNNDALADPATGNGGIMYGVYLGTIQYGNERTFKCTTAGVSGGSEPSFNLSDGSTTSDGSVTWTEIAGREAEQAAGDWKAPLANVQAWINAVNAAGSTLFLSSDHYEISGANVGVDWRDGNILNMFSVSRTGASLPPTASDSVAGASVQVSLGNVGYYGFSYVQGVKFKAGQAGSGSVLIFLPNGFNMLVEDCDIFIQGSGSGRLELGGGTQSGILRMRNTKIDGNPGSQQCYITINSQCYVDNLPTGSFNGWNGCFRPGSASGYNRFRACDFSSSASVFYNGTADSLSAGITDFIDCKLPAGSPFFVGTQNQISGNYRFWNCEDGGNTLSKFWQCSEMGILQYRADTSRFMGAFDGENYYGYQFQVDGDGTNTFWQPFNGVPLSGRVAKIGSAVTSTVYLASTVTLDNKKFWIELETLEDGADTLGSFHTSRVSTPLATPTTLTTDTSDWTQTTAARLNSHAYTQGAAIKVASNPGRLFICTASGTSNASEPGGFATAVDGGTVTDNGATFTAVNRYKVSIAWTPGRIGTVRAFPYFAPVGTFASTFVFLDPKLVTTA